MKLRPHAARKAFRSIGHSPSRALSGFTLVEMLVVIAIISVLAAILLPALAKAKTSARKVECLSRMKQWSLALLSYTHDNEEMLPREGYHDTGDVSWNNWPQTQDKRAQDVWYNALSNQVGVAPASSYAPSSRRRDFYERNSLFHCPSAPFPKTSSPLIALFSIAMNSQLIEPGRTPTISFSRITRPVQTVLFLENLLDDEPKVDPAQESIYLGQPSSTASRFAGMRHGAGGNLAFADGHAEWWLGVKVVETSGPNRGWAKLPQTEIVWDPELP